jgi:hypothetical protein
VDLAGEVGLGRTLAYDVARAGLLLPAHLTASYYPHKNEAVKSAESAQVSELLSKAKESALADKSALADRQKSALADSTEAVSYVEPRRKGGRRSKASLADKREMHRLHDEEGLTALQISRLSKQPGSTLSNTYCEMTVYRCLKEPPPVEEQRQEARQ